MLPAIAGATSCEIFGLTSTGDETHTRALHALAETLRTRLGPSAAKLLGLLRQWDIDGEGMVSIKEFRVAMRALQVRALRVISGALPFFHATRTPLRAACARRESGALVAHERPPPPLAASAAARGRR